MHWRQVARSILPSRSIPAPTDIGTAIYDKTPLYRIDIFKVK
jgi:hypothetical protein